MTYLFQTCRSQYRRCSAVAVGNYMNFIEVKNGFDFDNSHYRFQIKKPNNGFKDSIKNYYE